MIDLEFVRTIVSICSGIGTIGAAAGGALHSLFPCEETAAGYREARGRY